MRVLHRIPGRLRLAVPALGDPREVVAALEGRPGFLSWRWNHRTRSLLLLHDAQVVSSEALLEMLSSRLGWAAVEEGPAPASRRASPPALAAAIREGMAELDARVAGATLGAVDLRLLFPMGLFAWAVWELSRGAVAPLAWSSALWYAHGLFRDYNLPAPDG
jgi:hypothetical protein